MEHPQATRDRRILTTGAVSLAGWLAGTYVHKQARTPYNKAGAVAQGLTCKPVRRGLATTEGHGGPAESEALVLYRGAAKLLRPTTATALNLSELRHQLLSLVAHNVSMLTPLVAQHASESVFLSYVQALAEGVATDIPDSDRQVLEVLVASMRLMGSAPGDERDRQIIAAITHGLTQWLYGRHVSSSSDDAVPDTLRALTGEPILEGVAFTRGNGAGGQGNALDRLVATAPLVAVELRDRAVLGNQQSRRQLLAMVVQDVHRLTPVVAEHASMPVLRAYAQALIDGVAPGTRGTPIGMLGALVKILILLLVDGDGDVAADAAERSDV